MKIGSIRQKIQKQGEKNHIFSYMWKLKYINKNYLKPK